MFDMFLGYSIIWQNWIHDHSVLGLHTKKTNKSDTEAVQISRNCLKWVKKRTTNNCLSKSIKRLSAVLIFFLSCGTPQYTVNGVHVEYPHDLSITPEIITIHTSHEKALEQSKKKLLKYGFTIKETDYHLGILQTDEKIIDEDEDYTVARSDADYAACCLLGGTALVGIIAITAAIHDKKNQNNKQESDHQCTSNQSVEKPDIDKKYARIQLIIINSSDSSSDTTTTMEVSGFESIYKNGIKIKETPLFRLHPFIQKYACLLAHDVCEKAPGQIRIP